VPGASVGAVHALSVQVSGAEAVTPVIVPFEAERATDALDALSGPALFSVTV
jgi:hypothetical protein